MAGLLIPSFGERQDVGFFLNSLGWYQPIGEHFDLKAYVDYYTKGSWNIRPEVTYRKNTDTMALLEQKWGIPSAE